MWNSFPANRPPCCLCNSLERLMLSANTKPPFFSASSSLRINRDESRKVLALGLSHQSATYR